MDQTARDRINRSFDAQTMMTTLGARIESIQEGRVEISAPLLPGSLQQQGFGHSGLTYSIGDSSAGYAALTTIPMDSEVVTAEIKMNLLAPAKGELLIARGRVIKPGRRLVVVASEVYALNDGAETLIAVLQGTMVPVPV